MPPSSAEINNTWSYISTLPRAFMPGQLYPDLNTKDADRDVLAALLIRTRKTVSKWRESPIWWEQYISQQVFEFIELKFRTLALQSLNLKEIQINYYRLCSRLVFIIYTGFVKYMFLEPNVTASEHHSLKHVLYFLEPNVATSDHYALKYGMPMFLKPHVATQLLRIEI